MLVVAPVLVLPKLFGGSGHRSRPDPGIRLEQSDHPTGLAVAGRPLFPLPGGLARLSGRRVRGEAAVLAVASPTAFWVGTDDRQRLLVRHGRANPALAEGDPLVLEGTIRPLPADFPARFGVAAAGDVQLLRRQGHYIDATRVKVV